MASVTVVSNRLPARFVAEDGQLRLRRSDGGLVSALSTVLRERGGSWVGWPGHPGPPGADAIAALDHFASREGYDLVPVPLTADEQKDFYEGACNRLLWPLLHGLPDLTSPRPGDGLIYSEVNRRFARVTAERRPDLVWVQDYHLFLAGAELRRLLPAARLGFFLHVPFPPPDVMLQLGWAEEIVASLSAFDLIGFQTQTDLRGFLECAEQLRARTALRGGVPSRIPADLAAKADVFRISVDWGSYHDRAAEAAVTARAEALRTEAGGRRILLGVDRLDYTKGIPHRLRAYARLLEESPELRERVVFVQLAVPSRTGIAEYQRLRAEVEAAVRVVNQRFGTPGWTPVEYEYGTWSHQELLARYVAADVAVVTPLRDGMNLVAKEFCAANRGRGVLVLSRHAGAAHELAAGALLVNPADTGEVAAALREALAMEPSARAERLARVQAHLREHDVHRWADSFLERLERPRSGARRPPVVRTSRLREPLRAG